MSNFTVRLYPAAQKDLEEIFTYIAESLCNPKAAGELVEKFAQAFERVAQVPLLGTLVTNPGVANKQLRKLIVDRYIAFYLPDTDSKRIEVVRVLYGMMNYSEIL